MPKRFTLILGVVFCGIGLIVCVLFGCGGGSSPSVTTSITRTGSISPPTFPVVVSSNRRYLQDQKGMPFPILGRTAWFVTSLSETDYRMFIDDTVAKGFNAIEFHVINHDPRGNRPPFG